MGRNSAESSRIAAWLRKGPDLVHAAGLAQAIHSVAVNTYQDSGNASFNWNATKNSKLTFKYNYGIHPVGQRGDRRSASGDTKQTAEHRYQAASALIEQVRRGSVKESTVYNSISGDYAERARVEQAMALSKSEIKTVMDAEFRRWLNGKA